MKAKKKLSTHADTHTIIIILRMIPEKMLWLDYCFLICFPPSISLPVPFCRGFNYVSHMYRLVTDYWEKQTKHKTQIQSYIYMYDRLFLISSSFPPSQTCIISVNIKITSDECYIIMKQYFFFFCFLLFLFFVYRLEVKIIAEILAVV